MQGWKDASDAPVLQMRRFPARVEVSQSLQIKFPVPLRREFRCKSPNLARVFDASKGRIPCKLQKIPCKFPYIREFSREDQFVGDCIHRQAVRSLRASSGLQKYGYEEQQLVVCTRGHEQLELRLALLVPRHCSRTLVLCSDGEQKRKLGRRGFVYRHPASDRRRILSAGPCK